MTKMQHGRFRLKTILLKPFLLMILSIWIAACNHQVAPKIPDIPSLQNKNVILISLDTLRRDRVGAYGNPDSISPFIDRLSQSSVLFEDVASQSASTWTSHRSLFVSKYVSNHGKRNPVPGTTLAAKYLANGYRTAAFVDGGKMHSRYGHAEGFQEYDDTGGHLKAILPKATQWILDNRQDRFFLFLHTYDIHAPYNPLKHDDQVFLGDETIPDFYRTEAPIYLNTLNLDRGELNHLSRLYNGGVRSCDRQLKGLFNFLKAEDFLENTVIVVVSDHGESLGERDRLGHHEMYYSQLAVPLIMRIPAFPERLVHGTVENLDVMPTMLDLFGFDIPDTCQGISHKTSIRTGNVPDMDRYHLAENKQRTIFRDLGWKLNVGNSTEDDELYFLAADPAEESNVISSHSAEKELLLKKMPSALGVTEADIRVFKSNDLKLEVFKREDDTLKQQLEVLGYIEKDH